MCIACNKPFKVEIVPLSGKSYCTECKTLMKRIVYCPLCKNAMAFDPEDIATLVTTGVKCPYCNGKFNISTK